jgi:hypothetical protein
MINAFMSLALVFWGLAFQLFQRACQLIAKTAVFLALMAVLSAIVWTIPVLWELAVAAAIGCVYWIFFRLPPGVDD